MAGETAYDELLILRGYGTSDKDKNECAYLKLKVQEFLTEITAWKTALGLTHLHIVTSTGRRFDKGISMDEFEKHESKTLKFDATHRLVGFTGLASEGVVYSLGAIVLDTTCDIKNPIDPPVEEEPFFST